MRIRDRFFAEDSEIRKFLRIINRTVHIFTPNNLKKIYKNRKQKGVKVTLIEVKNGIFDGIYFKNRRKKGV